MTPEQTKRFKYWQTRTIIATMVGYALFYFVRKNFSLAMPGLEADLGISKTSLGIFLTLNGWPTSPSDSARMSPTGSRGSTTVRSSPIR